MSAVDTGSIPPKSYDPMAKALHWSMAVLIPLAWLLPIVSEDMGRDIRVSAMFWHRSLGALIFALLIVRILWRRFHTAPAIEASPFDPFGRWIAVAGHHLLYLLMVVVPLVGLVLNFADGRPLPFFGLFEIASPWAEKQSFAHALGEVHETTAHLLLIVALGHALIGILHHVVLRDRTLVKMSPFDRG